MRFLHSNRVWAALMRSSNTTRYVRVESHPSTLLTVSPQQIQDVKDKLGDLIPWVAKLEDNLLRADTKDREEMERRSQLEKFASRLCYLATLTDLCRSLDEIGGRSQALLNKGKMARALDKAQDAQAVVRLVDQLQRTIIVYQVCTGSHWV